MWRAALFSVVVFCSVRPRVLLVSDVILYQLPRSIVALFPSPLNCPRAVVGDLKAWVLPRRAKFRGPPVAWNSLLDNIIDCRRKGGLRFRFATYLRRRNENMSRSWDDLGRDVLEMIVPSVLVEARFAGSGLRLSLGLFQDRSLYGEVVLANLLIHSITDHLLVGRRMEPSLNIEPIANHFPPQVS